MTHQIKRAVAKPKPYCRQLTLKLSEVISLASSPKELASGRRQPKGVTTARYPFGPVASPKDQHQNVNIALTASEGEMLEFVGLRAIKGPLRHRCDKIAAGEIVKHRPKKDLDAARN